MTNNEAITRMKYRIETATDIAGKGVDGKAYEDMEMAIKALEEIQQYRAIGTVDECQEAREKQIGKKPKNLNYSPLCKAGWRYGCSVCGCAIGENINDTAGFTQEDDYCPSCGQSINWLE